MAGKGPKFCVKIYSPAPRDSGDSTLGADKQGWRVEQYSSAAEQLSGRQNMCPPGGRGFFLTIKMYFKRLNGD